MTSEEQWIEENTLFCHPCNARISKAMCENNKTKGWMLVCEGCKGVEMAKKCKVDGCEKFTVRNGMCVKHDKESMVRKGVVVGDGLSPETVAAVSACTHPVVTDADLDGATPKNPLLKSASHVSPAIYTLDLSDHIPLLEFLSDEAVKPEHIITLLEELYVNKRYVLVAA